MVVQKHYWQVTDAKSEKSASHEVDAVQSAAVSESRAQFRDAELAAMCSNSGEFDVNRYAPQESNL